MYLNDINLGRYWPVQGPQITLYVPKYFLKPWPAKNRLVIIEQDKASFDSDGMFAEVEFVSEPILNGETPATTRSARYFKKGQ